MARGKAELGDKTMIDAWTPAVEAAQMAATGGSDPPVGVLEAAAEAAETGGAMATDPLVARKGRASYLGSAAQGIATPPAPLQPPCSFARPQLQLQAPPVTREPTPYDGGDSGCIAQ